MNYKEALETIDEFLGMGGITAMTVLNEDGQKLWNTTDFPKQEVRADTSDEERGSDEQMDKS